jgi:hypothetical protein
MRMESLLEGEGIIGIDGHDGAQRHHLEALQGN